MTISLKDVALTADLLQAAAQQLGFETHVSPSPLIQAPTLCASSVLHTDFTPQPPGPLWSGGC